MGSSGPLLGQVFQVQKPESRKHAMFPRRFVNGFKKKELFTQKVFTGFSAGCAGHTAVGRAGGGRTQPFFFCLLFFFFQPFLFHFFLRTHSTNTLVSTKGLKGGRMGCLLVPFLLCHDFPPKHLANTEK